MSFKIDDYGALVWRNEKGQFHRENGPAIIYTDGHMEYCFDYLLHRLDGPAFINSNGSKEYWIHGEKYTKEEYYDKVKEL